MTTFSPAPPKSDFMVETYRKALEANSAYMKATGLPSLLNPMWHANTMDDFRDKHGHTPAFFSLPRLIAQYHGESGLELFKAVLQIKNAIRLMEANQ